VIARRDHRRARRPPSPGENAPPKKNAGRLVGHPAFFVDLQQRLNCALLAMFSLSPDRFRDAGA
jgi:hypothetical protein